MKRQKESGFALLLVFLFAAAIAISLYIEMPRVAFESQRAREQMAIDRGLQYKRAIQLFYRKFQTYPTTLEDLETTRNKRFLRRRYLDPLTGKDWRLVHVGPGGILTDSTIQPANQAQAGKSIGVSSLPGGSQSGAQQSGQSAQSSNDQNAQASVDANGQPVNPGLNMAARRPSDRVIGGGPEQPPADDPNLQAQSAPQYPAYPQQPGTPQFPGQPPVPGQPGQPQYPGQVGQFQNPAQPSQPQYPGQLGQVQNPQDPSQPQAQYPGQPVPTQDPSQPQQPAYPGQPQYPNQAQQQPAYPGQPQYPNPAQPAFPGQPAGYPGAPNTPPGLSGQTYNPFQASGQTGQPGSGANPTAGQQPNPAVNMIQQLLTTPRQPPASIAGSVTTGGVGIAGVGGVADGKGIHVVKDHSKYKQWEFIYDIKNDKTVVGAAAASQQQQMQQQQQTNQTGLQSNPSSTSTPAATSPFPTAPTSSPTSN